MPHNFEIQPYISFVIPVYNEEENIPILFRELTTVAEKLDSSYEIIFVNDCSSDRSLEVIRDLGKSTRLVRCVSFPENRGQSAALGAGFRAAAGEVIITMDADLQNDPADIPMLLEQFGQYDMVNGWRQKQAGFSFQENQQPDRQLCS